MSNKKKSSTKKVVKNNKDKINTINKFNILFVDIQIIFTILTVILFVIYLFNRSWLSYLQLSLGITLLVMAYNNHRIYKRAGTTILYAVVGVLLLVLDLLRLLVV